MPYASVSDGLLTLVRHWPRRALEALLVDACARGRLSRGKAAELLGLGFHDAEELFASCRVPYPAKSSADDALANAPLPPAR